MANDLARLGPTVLSKADPSGEDLLQARVDVRSNEGLRQLFLQGLSKEQLAERLTAELRELWRSGDPSEAAQFLVDEYEQLGTKGVLLVSPDTGRVIAILTDDAIYQPANVPRAGGSMAKPAPKIRPEIESAVISWVHDSAHEREVVKALAARGHQTALLQEMGDPRLLVATRAGRAHIVKSFASFDPQVLLASTGGTSGEFLQHFRFKTPPDDPELVHIHGTVTSKTVMRVQDPLTTNLHHNRPATMKGALVQGWVREISRMIYQQMLAQPRAGVVNVHRDTTLPHNFWVAPPDLVRPFKKIRPSTLILPIEDPTPAAMAVVDYLFGYIRVPKEFEAFNAEMFDRWEASTVLDFDIWYYPSRAQVYDVEGVELQAQVLL